jgi:hypothetical protein
MAVTGTMYRPGSEITSVMPSTSARVFERSTSLPIPVRSIGLLTPGSREATTGVESAQVLPVEHPSGHPMVGPGTCLRLNFVPIPLLPGDGMGLGGVNNVQLRVLLEEVRESFDELLEALFGGEASTDADDLAVTSAHRSSPIPACSFRWEHDFDRGSDDTQPVAAPHEHGTRIGIALRVADNGVRSGQGESMCAAQ